MAYDYDDMVKQSMSAIIDYKLICIDEIFAFVPFCSSTFYAHELEKLEILKEQLNKNKIKMKVDLKRKWYKSDSATLQIALYKLIGTEEERMKLTNIDITTKGQEMNKRPELSKEDVNNKLKALEEKYNAKKVPVKTRKRVAKKNKYTKKSN